MIKTSSRIKWISITTIKISIIEKNKIKDLYDLSKRTIDELSQLQHFGPQSIREVTPLLKQIVVKVPILKYKKEEIKYKHKLLLDYFEDQIQLQKDKKEKLIQNRKDTEALIELSTEETKDKLHNLIKSQTRIIVYLNTVIDLCRTNIYKLRQLQ